MLAKAYEVSGVDSINIPILWDQIAPLIEQALRYSDGEFNLQDIYSMLMYQKMQLWVVADEEMAVQACFITEFRNFPRMKICYIVLASGEHLVSWEHCFEELERWAYHEGASVMRAFGRKGWSPLARKLGYGIRQYMYTKELCNPTGISH